MARPHGLNVVTLTPGGGYGDAGAAYVAGLHALGVPVTWTPTVANSATRMRLEQSVRNAHGSITEDLRKLWQRQLACDAMLIHIPPFHGHLHWRQAEPNLRPFAYIAWEVEQVPDDWLPALNIYERVFVPSTFNRRALVGGGITAHVDVVPHVAREVASVHGGAPWGAVDDEDFVFYTIGSWITRKAMEQTICAYLDAFDGNDPVALIVKTDPMDQIACYALSRQQNGPVPKHHGMVWWRVAQILARYSNPAKLHLVAEHIPFHDIDRLHTRADCFISLTHSEGWGLGPFDAGLFGNPVIVTGWGGHLDYLGADYPLLVDYELEQTAKSPPDGCYLHSTDAYWARADPHHAGELMRMVYEDQDRARAIGLSLQPHLRDRYAPDRVCRELARLMGYAVAG